MKRIMGIMSPEKKSARNATPCRVVLSSSMRRMAFYSALKALMITWPPKDSST